MKYTKSHEWVDVDGEIATIGISNYAQEQLSDIVYVDFPEVGSIITKGEEVMTIESVKAASDIYSPISGEVVEVNSLLDESPETINQSAEDEGWLFKVKISDVSEYEVMIDEEEYLK